LKRLSWVRVEVAAPRRRLFCAELEILAAVIACPGPRSNSSTPELARLVEKQALLSE
jgi:hypothetical protein